MKVQDILTDESKWGKGAYGLSKDGKKVGFSSQDAVQFCLWGAILKTYGWGSVAETRVRDKLELMHGDCSISIFNDRFATFAEVRALIEELDI